MNTTADVLLFPQGWKKQVAKRMGVCPQTISRAICEKNHNYHTVIKIAKELYSSK